MCASLSRMFEESELAALRDAARKQIRARQRAIRAALSQEVLGARSARIVERVAELEEYVAARSVGLFWPLAREVDLRELDRRARAAGKRTFYPVMDGRDGGGYVTGFAEVKDVSELAPRTQRFSEPPPEARRATRGDIDLVVVPALAVSATGHRLGYGVGFYDITLPDFCPPALSVVVAYDFQLLAELPSLEHDVPGTYVVTDARTLRATSG